MSLRWCLLQSPSYSTFPTYLLCRYSGAPPGSRTLSAWVGSPACRHKHLRRVVWCRVMESNHHSFKATGLQPASLANDGPCNFKLVWAEGFEPSTSPVQAEYSDQTELHPDGLAGGTRTHMLRICSPPPSQFSHGKLGCYRESNPGLPVHSRALCH